MRSFLDQLTRRVAVLGFCGLVAMALLTMADALLRWTGLPRIPGFGDYGEVVFAIVIASCFPAGLMQGHNITIRFLGRAIGRKAAAWPEFIGALATLVFFSLLTWQFVLYAAELGRNGRTTLTLEMPIAPWWWLATAIMALTIPVQLLVVWERAWAALTGAGFDIRDQMTSEIESGQEP